jgi:hypothetical protein
MERSEAALASASAPKTGNRGPALGAETKAAFPFLLPAGVLMCEVCVRRVMAKRYRIETIGPADNDLRRDALPVEGPDHTSKHPTVRTTRVRSLAHCPALKAPGAMGEKRYRWHSERNTAQRGVEASTPLTKGWRVSDSAPGVCFEGNLASLGALKPLGYHMKYQVEANEIADRIRSSGRGLLDSLEWKALRRKVVNHYGRKCMKCGTTPKNPKHTQVDHVRPRKTHPELSMCFDNLQVLCCRCNKAKGNKTADYRHPCRNYGETHA